MRRAICVQDFRHDEEAVLATGIRVDCNGLEKTIGSATFGLLRRRTVEGPHRCIYKVAGEVGYDLRFAS
jgi:hypothetical protein